MSFLKRFRAVTGSKTVLEQLYTAYGKEMFKKANRILKDKQLAEDAVQEAFIRISRNTHKIGEVESKETRNYLITTVKRVSYDIYNERSIYNERNGPLAFFENEAELAVKKEKITEELYISKETYSEITEEIITLPTIYRDTFLMKHSLGYSNEEIAKELGITQENVRKRLQVARQKLAEKLKKQEGSDGK